MREGKFKYVFVSYKKKSINLLINTPRNAIKELKS